MAILEQNFYHKTINLYTGVFGAIFDKISIVRQDGKEIKVPIAYAGQQKHNVRNQQNPDPNESRYYMRLPRMSFRLTGWQKDDSRITNRNVKLTDPTVDRSITNGVVAQYNRVPYSFNYELMVKTKNIDDLLQVIEQIAVNFNPSIQVVVKDNPDLSGETAINITLNESSMEDNFIGEYDESRVIEATFNFTLDGYLYMPSSEYGVIKTIYLNYYEIDTLDDLGKTTITEDGISHE